MLIWICELFLFCNSRKPLSVGAFIHILPLLPCWAPAPFHCCYSFIRNWIMFMCCEVFYNNFDFVCFSHPVSCHSLNCSVSKAIERPKNIFWLKKIKKKQLSILVLTVMFPLCITELGPRRLWEVGKVSQCAQVCALEVWLATLRAKKYEEAGPEDVTSCRTTSKRCLVFAKCFMISVKEKGIMLVWQHFIHYENCFCSCDFNESTQLSTWSGKWLH